MVRKLICSLILLLFPSFCLTLAQAETYSLQEEPHQITKTWSKIGSKHQRLNVRFSLHQLSISKSTTHKKNFQKIELDQLPLTNNPGLPTLPFYAITLPVAPEDIEVLPKLGSFKQYLVDQILPAQSEPCRCQEDHIRPFIFNTQAYLKPNSLFKIEPLGDFRGKALTRILLFPLQYDPVQKNLIVYPHAQFIIKIKKLKDRKPAELGNDINRILLEIDDQDAEYDLLILSPPEYVTELEPWLEWKRTNQKLRLNILSINPSDMSAEALKKAIYDEYQKSRFSYAVIVGSQNKVPVHFVETSTSSQTPSDLPYFTMGGSDDFVPDVYAGRWVVENSTQVRNLVKKFLDYEKNLYPDQGGWARGISVASSEGHNPSDNEYAYAIERKMTEAFSTQFTHFYENDSTSNPSEFNNAMRLGAYWMTYIGHGSGTSWPSFGIPYSMSHIKQMGNVAQVKPFWMDVACQNGKLLPEYAGERLMNETDPNGNPIGVTAFYGGTVNISWHPPAILARGLAFKAVESERWRLGPLLQAGHIYLSENYSDKNELIYNQRWYHLQGDPSTELRFR